jgi:hypothetical protein
MAEPGWKERELTLVSRNWSAALKHLWRGGRKPTVMEIDALRFEISFYWENY